ncbi:MAG: SGNH/GDSL hydrolase family protein [Candidatus Omnitrophica bacterium]|nr:SGNH/GDSL hydrolase family protein [Candidatus Omnitrophota bacterium]
MRFKKTYTVFIIPLIVILWGGVFIIAAELFVRAVGRDRYPLSGIAYDAIIGWRNKRNMHYKKVKFNRLYSFTTNSRGFRDTEHSFLKKNNTKRIMFLGDSYTFGIRCSDEDIFTNVFERMINDEKGNDNNTRYEIMNVSSSAWSTDQELLYLMSEGVRYKPDYVILMIAQNDIRESAAKNIIDIDTNIHQLKRRRVSPVPWSVQLGWFLSNHFHSYQFLQEKILKNNQGTFENIFLYFPVMFNVNGFSAYDESLYLKNIPQHVEEARALFKMLLYEMNNFCIKNNSHLIAVILPAKMEFNGELEDSHYDVSVVSHYIQKVADEHNISFLNFFSLLQKEKRPLKIFFEDDLHFSAYGHDYIAQALCKYFITQRKVL